MDFEAVRFLGPDMLAVKRPSVPPATTSPMWTVVEARTAKPIREVDFDPSSVSDGSTLFGTTSARAVWVPAWGGAGRTEISSAFLSVASGSRIALVGLDVGGAKRLELRDAAGTLKQLEGVDSAASAEVRTALFSPDEKVVACAIGEAPTFHYWMGVWDVGSGKRLTRVDLALPGPGDRTLYPKTAVFSPDSAWLAIDGRSSHEGDKNVVVIDVARRTIGRIIPGEPLGQANPQDPWATFSKDGHFLGVVEYVKHGTSYRDETTVYALPGFKVVRRFALRMPTCSELPCEDRDDGTRPGGQSTATGAVLTNEAHVLEVWDVGSRQGLRAPVIFRDGMPRVLQPPTASAPVPGFFSGDASHLVRLESPARIYRVDGGMPIEIPDSDGALQIASDGVRLAVVTKRLLALYELRGETLTTLWQIVASGPRVAALYQQACDGGHASGCTRLASLYGTGSGGMGKDEARAAALYQRGCDGGDSSGCSNLGIMFERGTGVPADEPRALLLYKQACFLGDHEGCALLSHMVERGTGRGVAPK
jgi:hypothetical protein